MSGSLQSQEFLEWQKNKINLLENLNKPKQTRLSERELNELFLHPTNKVDSLDSGVSDKSLTSQS